MRPRIEIPAEKRQQAYVQYASQPEVLLGDIARGLGVGASTFARLRQHWGWPPRLAALAENDLRKAMQDKASVPEERMAAAASVRDTARSLARATRVQIDALLEEQRAGRIADHDKTSRTLASYARTLKAAQELLEQESAQPDETERHDKPRRNLHELREELSRHLDRVIAEEEARGSDGLLI